MSVLNAETTPEDGHGGLCPISATEPHATKSLSRDKELNDLITAMSGKQLTNMLHAGMGQNAQATQPVPGLVCNPAGENN